MSLISGDESVLSEQSMNEHVVNSNDPSNENVIPSSPNDEFAIIDQADDLLCDFCNSLVPTLSLADHSLYCPMYPVACPNKCDQLVARCDVTLHVDKMCPMTSIRCPFYATGCVDDCPKVLNRCGLKFHVTNPVVMSEALCGLVATVSELSQKLEQVEKEVVELNNVKNNRKLHLRTRSSL